MQASVKIMDVDVDMMSNGVFIQKMNEYLTDDRVDVILFASTEMLKKAVEDVEYRQKIDQAELLLPGEKALLTMHHVDVLEAGDMVVNCDSLGMMLENLKKQDRSIYIIAETNKDRIQLKKYCRKMQPEIRIVGGYNYQDNLEDAAVINEINSHTPDMLLINLPLGMQEDWITEHLLQLNVKLCIALGGVANIILAKQKKIPGWIKKLHLSRLYSFFIREQSVKKDLRARIFRKKVVHYNKYNQYAEETREENTKDDSN